MAAPALYVRAVDGAWSVFRFRSGKHRLVAGPFPVLAAATRYIAQVEKQRRQQEHTRILDKSSPSCAGLLQKAKNSHASGKSCAYVDLKDLSTETPHR